MHRGIMFLAIHPHRDGFGGFSTKNIFARNCMKCADLHRKSYFCLTLFFYTPSLPSKVGGLEDWFGGLEDWFSVQICTFYAIPSNKFSLLLYPSPSSPEGGAYRHDFSLQICTFHSTPSKKYFGIWLPPLQPAISVGKTEMCICV